MGITSRNLLILVHTFVPMGTFNIVSVFSLIFLQICSSTFLRVIEDATGKEICSKFEHINCTLVEVNSSDLEKEEISLLHPLRGHVSLHKQNPDEARNVFVGEEGTQAIFSIEDGRVLGNINFYDVGVFLIAPCGLDHDATCHLWIEPKPRDESEDDIHIKENTQGNDYQLQIEDGKRDDGRVAEISIMFYYTLNVPEEISTTISELFNQIVDITNQGFSNSKIPIKVKIHCIEALEIRDAQLLTGNELQIFKAYARKKNRDIYRSADAAALITGDIDGFGGKAYYGFPARSRLSVTNYDSALTRYTFGHELGHNLGADHNIEVVEEHERIKDNHGYGSFY